MDYSFILKQRLKKNALRIVKIHKLEGFERESAYIFKNIKFNFFSETFKNIHNHNGWKARTEKHHSRFSDGTLEMQSSNSSDALLMNIFCHPEFKKLRPLTRLLDVKSDCELEFGWNPEFENETHPTEIDLKIGNRIFEAKLTEKSFTSARKDIVKRYADYSTVFTEEFLIGEKDYIKHYQLIRNILTAYQYDYSLTVLLDSTRIDLIKEIFNVIKSIRVDALKKKISFITWQEIIDTCKENLKEYLAEKYL